MHAPAGRATPWIMIVLMSAFLGCRGSGQFGRYVQVTESSEQEIPEIEAPPQRLATAKPRSSDDSPAAVSSAHSTTTSGTVSPPTTRSSQARTDTKPVAGGIEPDPKTARKIAEALAVVGVEQPSSPIAPATPSQTSNVSPNVGPSPQVDEAVTAALASDELFAVLQDFPPELREQALRQFVAAAARSAGQTSQPNGVASELAKTVNDLPELPAPKSTAPAVPPARIAASDLQAQPVIGSLSDSGSPDIRLETQLAETQRPENRGATASLSDVVGDELEPVSVQTMSKPSADTGEVQTASAATDGSRASMVSQALADVPAPINSERSLEPSAVSAGTTPQSDAELLAELVKRLSTETPGENEAAKSSRMIKLRHLLVLSGDPDAAVAQVEGMPEAQQEYLRHHLLGLWTMIDPQGHPVPSRRFSTAITQIREAAKYASAATDSLEVRSLAFCTEIESYGQITPFAGNRFDPGQQVILYCEIDNFAAKRVEDGFETHLQGSFDVFDSKNGKVFSQILPADQQVSANHLRDFFIAYQMYLPNQISPGTYRLQLTMEDVNGKKYGQSSIPFEIAQ